MDYGGVTISEVSLGLMVLLALLVLLHWQRCPDQFDLRWVLVDTETQKVSLFKAGQLVALVVSTYAFVVLVQRDKLTEWFFAGYMLTWAGANLANKWITNTTGQK